MNPQRRLSLMVLAAACLPGCATLPQQDASAWRTEFRELEDGQSEVRTYNRAGELLEVELLPKWSRT